MHRFTSHFSAQDAAMASGCGVRKISDWASRGLLVGHSGGGARGRNRHFSWFNVMEAAIANELLSIGMSSVTDAFRAAQHFAHLGEATSGWVGQVEPVPIPRLPGMPWHHNRGYTFMFVWGDASDIQLTNDKGTVDLNLLAPARHHVGGFIVINVTEVFMRICLRMDLDYRLVLDEAYPQEATVVRQE